MRKCTIRAAFEMVLLLALADAAAGLDITDSTHVFKDERKSPDRTAYVTLLGDFGAPLAYLERLSTDSPAELEALRSYLSSRDLVVGNFEMVDPDELETAIRFLDSLGIHAMGLANNHAGDHGDAFLRRVERELERHGLAVLGLDRKPFIERSLEGQRIRILATAGNFDHPTEEALSVYDPAFDSIRRDFLSEGDVHVLYGHLGIASFIDEYDRSTTAAYIAEGFEAVVYQAKHFPKGFLSYDDGFAVIAPGDFLFPNHSDRLVAKDKLSSIATLGFEDGRCVYYEVLVFLSEMPGRLRLADAAERDEFVVRLAKAGDVDPTAGYASAESRLGMRRLLRATLDPRKWLKVRPHHLRHAWRYAYYNHRPLLLGALGLMTAGLIGLALRRKRGASARTPG